MGTHPIFESDFDCLTGGDQRSWTKIEIDGPPDDDLLICDDCDQTFTSAVLFRIHKRAHENEHKYVLGVQQEMEECDRAEEKRRAIEDDDDAPSGSGLSKL